MTVAFGLTVVVAAAACDDGVAEDATPSSENADTGLAAPDAGAVPIDTTTPSTSATTPVPADTAPSCAKYCSVVGALDSDGGSCTGDNLQYGARDECLAFCSRLPLGSLDAEHENSVGCRQHFAGTPAKTDATSYCLAAGPFGGGVCGDRCTTFCQLTLSVCQPDAGPAPYANLPECSTACAAFHFEESPVDHGGEKTSGPDVGDTLNCREFHLRTVLRGSLTDCGYLGVISDKCKNN